MKTNASFQSSFLFQPEMSLVRPWPTAPRVKTRPRALGLAMETQIDYKSELFCGVILILCLLSGLAAFVAQFAVA